MHPCSRLVRAKVKTLGRHAEQLQDQVRNRGNDMQPEKNQWRDLKRCKKENVNVLYFIARYNNQLVSQSSLQGIKQQKAQQ